jgi:hypothetical protein
MVCNKPLSQEAEREQWLDQLIADPGLKSSYFRVAWAIACHMNRNENGWAWPGFNRLAEKAKGYHLCRQLDGKQRSLADCQKAQWRPQRPEPLSANSES